MTRLTARQLALFQAGCENPDNYDAQALLNVFAVQEAVDVLERIPAAPLNILVSLATHFWRAVRFEDARSGIATDDNDRLVVSRMRAALESRNRVENHRCNAVDFIG